MMSRQEAHSFLSGHLYLSLPAMVNSIAWFAAKILNQTTTRRMVQKKILLDAKKILLDATNRRMVSSEDAT
jgi:hypothetical protein